MILEIKLKCGTRYVKPEIRKKGYFWLILRCEASDCPTKEGDGFGTECIEMISITGKNGVQKKFVIEED